MSAPASFTPSTAVDPSKERDWPAQLGLLDWDSTSIVFTKRSLLEFLKYAGVSVDTNFTNIQKLPRYAQFGKLASGPPAESAPAPPAAAPEPAATESTPATDFKPTRRVRDPPGGRTHNIFGGADDDDNDALSAAPPQSSAAAAPAATAEASTASPEVAPAPERKKSNNSSAFASLWDAPDDAQAFKPTRKVRERPGGKDSISGLF
ncbi:hypothetical protein DICSQDRAFT_135514 [Dichomitus squalens LYAD-421 SS1]|uniref:uncharacterized protein n=1 Tax=Dichomitus squalens (strain LYAD-421) TaxID=732165 RepID=UPI00044108C6|nr:uncharacterized protein DICSQDRAFT_135514 [Dichomitus squalens LYAD-421 SS1]EJF62553.1 hypothetical protein DICSQDRAFT_135514 [Dichomitus squalens LYAD-421 SS1]